MAWLSDSWRVVRTGLGARLLAKKSAGEAKINEIRELAENLASFCLAVCGQTSRQYIGGYAHLLEKILSRQTSVDPF